MIQHFNRTSFILLLFVGVFSSCKKESTHTHLFSLLPSEKTGITFNNKIKDDKEKNILLYANFYGGAGVGIGDFNNDGLEDVYFAGNLVDDKLYLNQGDFKFEDQTEAAGIINDGSWSTGVVVADVNNDGNDDLVAANANGNIYCYDSSGKLLWQFASDHKVRFSEVAVVKNKGKVQVFAGGNDFVLYELNSNGKLVSETKIEGVVRKLEAGNFISKDKEDLFLMTYEHDKFRWDFLGLIDANSKEVIKSVSYKKNQLKQLKKLMILGGFRYEKTNFDYTSGTWNEDDETASTIKGTNDYGFLLPMLHLKYSINENNIIRGSLTKSYSRPNFVDMVQGATFNDEEASISNPDLKPVKAFNVDIFSEHYFGSIGLLSGCVFYKKLNDFIYQQTTDRDFGGYEDIEVTQSINGDEASLFGFEIGYQQNLSFLPGFLKGFVVYLNYTHSNSTATVKNFAQGEDLKEIDLPGTAENIGNAALAYNYKGFKARISVNYIDSFISEFDGGDIVLIEDRTQVDFSMSQTFSKRRFTAFLELVNLTDANQIEIFNTAATPKERQQFGMWGRLGLRFNF